MTDRSQYPPFTDSELVEGVKFLRQSDKYNDLVPPPGTIKIDWYLLRAIGIEVNRRRPKEGKILPKLTGTVVREFIPDVSPETRRLGEAYRDATMAMFQRRKSFLQSRRRKTRDVGGDVQERGQPRLL